MNLKEDIFKALEGKGYDDFAKIRWVYLYICEIFSYDTRFYYANQDIKKDIYNKKIDIVNVTEHEIICYTISRILADVLIELGYDAIVIRESETGFSHAYVEVKYQNYFLKLDPTIRHDITRKKLNSTILDFESLKKDDDFSKKLLETDRIIAHDFNGLYLNNKSVADVIKDFLMKLEIEIAEKNLSNEEIFFKKLGWIYEMVNSKTDLKRYDDIDFYYSYLLRSTKINIKECFINGEIKLADYRYIKPVILFKKDDKSMKDIINISYIQYENLPPIFYLLKKDGENYVAREIFREEAIEILKEYRCPIEHGNFMLEGAVKKLATGKKNGIIL